MAAMMQRMCGCAAGSHPAALGTASSLARLVDVVRSTVTDLGAAARVQDVRRVHAAEDAAAETARLRRDLAELERRVDAERRDAAAAREKAGAALRSALVHATAQAGAPAVPAPTARLDALCGGVRALLDDVTAVQKRLAPELVDGGSQYGGHEAWTAQFAVRFWLRTYYSKLIVCEGCTPNRAGAI